MSLSHNNIIEKFQNIDSHHSQACDKEKFRWTTWLHNAILNRPTILPSNKTNLNINNTQ